MNLATLDQAVRTHLGYSAGAIDPGHEATLQQIEACAPEGGQVHPPVPVPRIGMWDDEVAHPWIAAALYGGALLASVVGGFVRAWWAR